MSDSDDQRKSTNSNFTIISRIQLTTALTQLFYFDETIGLEPVDQQQSMASVNPRKKKVRRRTLESDEEDDDVQPVSQVQLTEETPVLQEVNNSQQQNSDDNMNQEQIEAELKKIKAQLKRT